VSYFQGAKLHFTVNQYISPLELSGILSISTSLVLAYVEIACEHHPEIIGHNPYLPLKGKDISSVQNIGRTTLS